MCKGGISKGISATSDVKEKKSTQARLHAAGCALRNGTRNALATVKISPNPSGQMTGTTASEVISSWIRRQYWEVVPQLS